jgi:hypothetical protein
MWKKDVKIVEKKLMLLRYVWNMCPSSDIFGLVII